MLSAEEIKSFEDMRPKLIGLAYRMLGSLSDAEDAVQDTFLKWSSVERGTIKNPSGWLVTSCTHRCIDMLRSAQRSRVDYIGAWLPEPTQTTSDGDQAESRLDLSASLSTAFLLMLERLTEKERAAYLLHDVFDLSYGEIAQILNMKEPACRKLVSRAKSHIGQDNVRATAPVAHQESLLEAFQIAISTGETKPLANLLADDVKLSADGGGKAPAILDVLRGKKAVLDFVSTRLKTYWQELDREKCELNGALGFVIGERSTVHATVSFSFDDEGQADGIYIMRNPEKLLRFRSTQLQ